MKRTYQELWTLLGKVETPPSLRGSVLASLHAAQLRAERMRTAFFSTLTVGSFFSLFPALRYCTELITQSGFQSYASLVFSDTGSLATHWQPFLFSLLESLPLIGIAIALTTVIVFLWALVKTTQHAHVAFA